MSRSKLFRSVVGSNYRGADKSLARPGKETSSEACQVKRAISTTSRRELSSSFFPLQGKAPKEIHAILTETLACFLSGRAKDLSAPCKWAIPVVLHTIIRRGRAKSNTTVYILLLRCSIHIAHLRNKYMSSSYMSWSRSTCWPVPVSRIQKSLQMSTMIPSASWTVVFHYPG